MWLEIIGTAIATSVVTHLVPHAYTYLKGKFVSLPAVREGTQDGGIKSYYVNPKGKPIDGMKFKARVAPARQTVLLGDKANYNPEGTYEGLDLELEEAIGNTGITPEVIDAISRDDREALKRFFEQSE